MLDREDAEVSTYVEGDFLGDFFAPASTDMVDGLIGQYQAMRARIEQLAEMIAGETGAVWYFVEGNKKEDSRYSPSVEELFDLDGAIAKLNADYWSKALALTDVRNMMPQSRRDEWDEQLRNPKGRKEPNRYTGGKALPRLPDFQEDTVRATLLDLLNSRSKFFAERVDGVFRALSHEHVTNCPQGFSKRMILGYVFGSYGSSSQAGHINDLRAIIAKFMGRDEPGWNATGPVIAAAQRNYGKWMTIDGGALRIRVYMKGTAHLEIHPDMAWRLNAVLASMYPAAIPASFRTPPKRKPKDVALIMRPLPFAVIDILSQASQAYRFEKTNDFRNPYNRIPIPNSLELKGYSTENASKHTKAEAGAVLESIGGVKTEGGWYQFDYNPCDVLDEIISSGCIPDQKSYQFYPTPETVALAAVEAAEIEGHHNCLEPSAGTGGLADHMPKQQTTCVEVSSLRCEVLKAKGYKVICEDFLRWAETTMARFDRVILNPPFDQGRWKAHLEAAAMLVEPGGKLVAILPASAQGKDLLPGFACRYPRLFDNEFAGTSISVVLLVAEPK